MSFVITVYVPGAIVMAADSRQSIIISKLMPDGAKQQAVETVNSDFVYKIFLLQNQRIGISAFGESVLGKVNIESHVKRFQEEKLKNTDDISSVTKKLCDFIGDRFPNNNTTFHIAGFNKESGVSIPYVYLCHTSRKEIQRLNAKPENNEVIYGASWGGQGDIIAGLLYPKQMRNKNREVKPIPTAPIIWDTMPIQDAIDFAIYAVRTTIDTIRFQARPKNVGGPIDVLLLTPDMTTWIQRKEHRGQPT